MAGKLSHKKVLVIGGGTGVFTALTGLKQYFSDLTAIVTMADNGGSTGVLREEFGILPPGDVRRALVALSTTDNKMLSELFSFRFSNGNGLSGHNFGNLLITALAQMTGDFEQAIAEAARILQVKGKIIPSTLVNSHLYAQLESGTTLKGETNIDIPKHDPKLRITNLWLGPRAVINPNARRAILGSDLVVIGPGDLYTSILPNLLVGGMSEALRETGAKVVYVVNVMTKLGETNGFGASDFISVVKEYVGEGVIDYILVNDKQASPARLKAYAEEGAAPVENDLSTTFGSAEVVATDLIRSRGFVRHDPDKLAQALLAIAGRSGNTRKPTRVVENKFSLFAP